ncbi:MAG: septal ring lytic transglycosylase RlpA family protein [Candidatus Cloacimonetes bacterium]|nr:septal ring lytic transglycosylase RlpA family protein [Candidatus Cloacimonadota bacterium]
MKKISKKLLVTFLGFQLMVVMPIIAESVTSPETETVAISQTELVIDSLQTQEPPGAPPGETMIATYYGKRFHGRKTASGERYDHYAMSCAHKDLPFQTLLKVTNPKNGKSVHVRVNDRGPFPPGRDLDLSYAAAKEIDMLAAGVIPVEVQIITEEVPDSSYAKR